MAAIRYQFTFNAPPEKVYQALTEQEQMRKWWTTVCHLQPKQGTKARIDFKPYGDYIEAIIESLVPNTAIRWRVTDSKMLGTADWNETEINFDLKDNGKGGTDVEFVHSGWKSETECFVKCTVGWGYYAGESLKAYLETGKGDPVPEILAA